MSIPRGDFPGPSINKQLEQLERYSANASPAPALAAGSLPAAVPVVSVGVARGVSGSRLWAGATSEHRRARGLQQELGSSLQQPRHCSARLTPLRRGDCKIEERSQKFRDTGGVPRRDVEESRCCLS